MNETHQSGQAVAAAEHPKIAISNLRKTFRAGKKDVVAIDDISLQAREGEFLVIVGPSGCGKSTLLRILAELEMPTEGKVEIARSSSGRPLNSMVFQGDSLFSWMTVRDNAGFGLKLRGFSRDKIRQIVNPYLEKVGLLEFADAFPHQLSGGMRQRVSIVRAFANDPEVLLMDEPFSALDELNKVILQQELLRIWEETRKTVVFITHSIDEALILGDRIVVMSAQPGRCKAIIDVPFARPRRVMDIKADPLYAELSLTIWGHLEDEIIKSRRLGGVRS